LNALSLSRPRGTTLFAGLLLAPLFSACVWLYGDRWAPLFDIALIEMRVRDVGTSHSPLVGLGGRLATWPEIGCHPGPMAFYLLAPLYRLLGGTYWALRASTVCLAAVAVVSSLLIARRRLGDLGVIAVAVGMALLHLIAGPLTLTLPWNPFIPVVWYVTFLLSIWSIFSGDVWFLPAAAALGTLCAQTHISFLPVCVGLSFLAVIHLLSRWWHAHRAAQPTRAFPLSLASAGAVTLVLWLPPVIEQLSRPRGNMTILAEHFLHPPEAVLGVPSAALMLFRATDRWSPGGWIFAAIHLLWAFSFAAAFKLKKPGLLALHATVAATLVIGLIGASRIIGQPLPHVTLFVPSGAALMIVASLATFGSALSAAGSRLRRWKRAAEALSVVLVAASSILLLARIKESSADNPNSSAQVAALARDTARGIERGIYVITTGDALFGGGQGYGFLVELERRGIAARLTDNQLNRSLVGAHRVVDPKQAANLHVTNAGWTDVAQRKRGAARIAYSEVRTAEEQAEFSLLVERLRESLRRSGREDALPLLDRNLSAAPTSSVTDALTVMRIIRIGMPATVFLLPREVEDEPSAPNEQAFTSAPPSGLGTAAVSQKCALDLVGSTPAAELTVVHRDSSQMLAGWAVDIDSQSVPESVFIELSGKKRFYAKATGGIERPDVAAALKSRVFEHAGYQVSAAFGAVDAGDYAVNVIQLTAAGKTLTCATTRKLRIE
jgi:hypothetical protein